MSTSSNSVVPKTPDSFQSVTSTVGETSKTHIISTFSDSLDQVAGAITLDIVSRDGVILLVFGPFVIPPRLVDKISSSSATYSELAEKAFKDDLGKLDEKSETPLVRRQYKLTAPSNFPEKLQSSKFSLLATTKNLAVTVEVEVIWNIIILSVPTVGQVDCNGGSYIKIV
jgi:hypothetical protein